MAAPDGKYARVMVVKFRKDNQVKLGEPCSYFQQIPLTKSTFLIKTASGKVAAHRDEKEKQQLYNRKRAELRSTR